MGGFPFRVLALLMALLLLAGCAVVPVGEDVPAFMNIGSYNFFCEKFKSFIETPHSELPYDLHFLIACQAPGLVFVTGATKDSGMDPLSEYVSLYKASSVYSMFGGKGLVTDGTMPQPGVPLIDGEIGFYIRDGQHFISREDWNVFMDFFERNIRKETMSYKKDCPNCSHC